MKQNHFGGVNLIFKNIGSAVIKFDNNELKCYGFDGIVGANLLAHLFCEFNYQENKIFVSKLICKSIMT